MSTDRWEWRTFGTDFGRGEQLLQEHVRDTRTSHETYLVSARDDINVKVRDCVLNVNTRVAVAPNQLEQWTPLLKAPFPLTAPAIDQLFAGWHLPVPSALPMPLTQRHFAQMIEELTGAVQQVPVSKLRHGGEMCGCIIEIVELDIDGQSLRTVAIEGSDPAHVFSIVQLLDLGRFENISYVKQLQRLLPARSSLALPTAAADIP